VLQVQSPASGGGGGGGGGGGEPFLFRRGFQSGVPRSISSRIRVLASSTGRSHRRPGSASRQPHTALTETLGKYTRKKWSLGTGCGAEQQHRTGPQRWRGSQFIKSIEILALASGINLLDRKSPRCLGINRAGWRSRALPLGAHFFWAEAPSTVCTRLYPPES
jgi:hypothetical protein